MSSRTYASISVAVSTMFYQTAMFLTALQLDHCQQEHSSVSAREQEMECSITAWSSWATHKPGIYQHRGGDPFTKLFKDTAALVLETLLLKTQPQKTNQTTFFNNYYCKVFKLR